MPKTFMPKTAFTSLLLLLSSFPALAGNLPLPLETLPNKTFADVQAQAKAESTGGPIWGNAPDPSLLPVHQTFTGTVTADATMTRLAIFSDDGADVYVDGTLVWSSKDKPQALPDTASSLHDLPVTLSAGSHSVQIDYSNIIYTVANAAKGVPPDIDGCTLYMYGPSAAPTVKVTTGDWQPNPAAVGQTITSAVSASALPSPQAPSGHTVSQSWTWATGGVYQSADGASGSFTKYTGNYGIGWDQGAATTQFRGVFYDPGYYIIKVTATVTFHDDTANANLGTYSGFNYIGGSAGDLAAGTSAAPAATARLAPAAAGSIKGVPVKTVPVTGIQYKDPATGSFVTVSGTLYVLKNTTLTFKAVSSPATLTFPAGQPTWSGTSGATGTGQTLPVSFATVSTSATDYKTVVAASAKPAADTANSVNVVVVSLALKQVSFSGSGSHTVLNDKDGSSYSAPQWQDTSTPPGSGTAGSIQALPLCYTQGTTASVSVSLAPVPAIPSGSTLITSGQVKIKGTSANSIAPGQPNFNLPATAATVDTTGVSISATPLANAFPTTVAYISNIAIQWNYSNDGGTTYQTGGVSNHKVYVTLGDPLTKNLYQTVLETGCQSANGDSDPIKVIADIAKLFSGLVVKRAVDGKAMQYWGPIASPKPGIFDTAGLIKNADGRCGAWSGFLSDVFGAQSIEATPSNIWTTDPTPSIPGWTYVPAQPDTPNHGLDVYPANPAQSNKQPAFRFDGHAVVKISAIHGIPVNPAASSPYTTIYDPSYGKTYAANSMPAAEQSWEDASVQDYWWHFQDQDGMDRFPIVNDNKNQRETIFN